MRCGALAVGFSGGYGLEHTIKEREIADMKLDKTIDCDRSCGWHGGDQCALEPALDIHNP